MLAALQSIKNFTTFTSGHDNAAANEEAKTRRKSITATATPGLMTLLDVALYRTHEGQLTRTVCAANSTLECFLQLKTQSNKLLELCLVPNSMQFASAFAASDSSSSSGGSNNNAQRSNGTAIAERLHSIESFARFCDYCVKDAIHRLTTDKLSASANLPTYDSQHLDEITAANEAKVAFTNKQKSKKMDQADKHILLGILSHASFSEADRRLKPLFPQEEDAPSNGDCWESPLLHCPDYVWADDAHLHCQRLVRNMTKHDFLSTPNVHKGNSSNANNSKQQDSLSSIMSSTQYQYWIDPSTKSVIEQILNLLRYDLPLRMHQFRSALESDGTVSKRLYLIKNEYRVPFRIFLESHQMVQQLPQLSLLERYLKYHEEGDANGLLGSRKAAEQKIQDCIHEEGFMEAMKLEEDCETLEMELARTLMPSCELARMLDGKGARLVEVEGILQCEEVPFLQEILRRLRLCLNRKPGAEANPGIRPLLLDLQGIPRDPFPTAQEISPFRLTSDEDINEKDIEKFLDIFCSQLEKIHDITKMKGYHIDKKESGISQSILRACSNFDKEKFCKAYMEWYQKCKRQRELSLGESQSNDGSEAEKPKNRSFGELAEIVRLAEIEVTIALASQQKLTLVTQRLDKMEQDRMKKFEILQEIVEEVCLREMDFYLKLNPLKKDVELNLPEVPSAAGVLSHSL